MKRIHLLVQYSFILLAILGGIPHAAAQGTAFTYQGSLDNGGNPANGSYDMTFGLFYSASGATQVGTTITNLDIIVTNGLFMVTNDFGAVYNGTPYWLQIGVRASGGGTFTPLTPRQELTPVPYSIAAENIIGTVPASQLPSPINLITDPGTQNFFAGAAAGNSSLTGANDTSLGNSTLTYNSSGSDDTAVGLGALEWNSTGSYNTGTGYEALSAAYVSLDVTGNNNTANGAYALTDTQQGSNNAAFGYQALANNTTGSGNAALGYQAGYQITTGGSNIDIGNQGLSSDNNIIRIGSTQGQTYIAGVINGNGSGLTNISASTVSGQYDTAVGVGALTLNSTGSYNTAFGDDALAFNSTGSSNTAVGANALGFTGGGDYNTAIGANTLVFSSGGGNTAVGLNALYNNRTGYNSTVLGYNADMNEQDGLDTVAIGVSTFEATTTGNQNTAVGTYAFQNMTAGSGNVGLGYYAGNGLVEGTNNIYIGNPGSADDNEIIRIGNGQTDTYISGKIHNPVFNQITITGGSDLAEPFKISSPSPEIPVGSVVVIDENNPGRLKVSSQAYDAKVAGVLSGANGIHPGIQMQQEGLLEGGRNVALTGRVYVLADASGGSIQPGDLLTTSSTPGHAMKVTDHAKAQGAILGKAMSGLKEGKGMVLVLVTLQ
jgi:hypothetical protein